MSIASVNGIDISYIIHKPEQGRPAAGIKQVWVVLINGLADEKESWAYQIPAFTGSGYTVLAFDNRGIGKTSAPAGPYTASLMAADAHALVAQLQISKMHLIGVSMGGMIAQRYALDYHENIVSLTLACTYAAPGPFCGRMFDLWADTAQVMGVPHVMREVLLWCFSQDMFNNRPEELRELEESMKFMTMSVPAYLAQLAVIQRFDTTKELGSLPKVPTMVLAGDDILIPVSLSKELHELIPWSTWRTVNGGHGCCWEYPDEFNGTILDFLRQAESKPS